MVLPLRMAYPFGADHGMGRELDEIRNMRIDDGWRFSYTSSVRRGYVIELFQRKAVFDEFKRQCWRAGSDQQIRFYLGLRTCYERCHQGTNVDCVCWRRHRCR